MFDELMAKIDARPDNFGTMKDASAHAKIKGPCGDTVEVWLRIDGGKIRKASFMSDGCAYSSACCSAAAKLTEGMTPSEADQLGPDTVLSAVGSVPSDHQHCALLATNVIKKALADSSVKPAKKSFQQKLKQMFSPNPSEKNHV